MLIRDTTHNPPPIPPSLPYSVSSFVKWDARLGIRVKGHLVLKHPWFGQRALNLSHDPGDALLRAVGTALALDHGASQQAHFCSLPTGICQPPTVHQPHALWSPAWSEPLPRTCWLCFLSRVSGMPVKSTRASSAQDWALSTTFPLRSQGSWRNGQVQGWGSESGDAVRVLGPSKEGCSQDDGDAAQTTSEAIRAQHVMTAPDTVQRMK